MFIIYAPDKTQLKSLFSDLCSSFGGHFTDAALPMNRLFIARSAPLELLKIGSS
jgi:hypothetical protein